MAKPSKNICIPGEFVMEKCEVRIGGRSRESPLMSWGFHAGNTPCQRQAPRATRCQLPQGTWLSTARSHKLGPMGIPIHTVSMYTRQRSSTSSIHTSRAEGGCLELL
jgi:hypothetical protein